MLVPEANKSATEDPSVEAGLLPGDKAGRDTAVVSEFEDFIDTRERKRCSVCCAEECPVSMKLIWDGLGFFGFSTYKLPRILAGSWGYMDRLTNPQEILHWIFVITAVSLVIYGHSGQMGDLKAHEISYSRQHSFSYDAAKAMRLINVITFSMAPLAQKLQLAVTESNYAQFQNKLCSMAKV